MSRILDRLRRHLADPDSHHRKIALGFVWVSLFVFVGKLAGAAKEMAIAWRYGVSSTVDAYVFVFNLVTWPVAVWFSMLTVVLVPLAARLGRDSPAELPRFRAELLGLTLLFGLGLGLAAWLALPTLLRTGWLGLSGAALTQALHMTGGLTLLLPLGTAISLFSAWLLAAGKHRNTLFEAVPALTLLIVLLLPPGWMPEPLLWGTVAGFALHAAALSAPLRQRGELPAPSLAQRSPAWQLFWGSIGIVSVGQVLMSFSTLIDQFFAAGLGEGALSTLSYANRILALILGLGATAISRATLPVFSALQTKNEKDVNALALYWVKVMFAFGLVTLTVTWTLAPWGVGLLFQRGAFTAEDSARVTEVLRFALIQIPPYFAGLVVVAVLVSKQKYVLISLVATTNAALKLVLSYYLSDEFGVVGLMISNAVVQMTSLLLCLLAVSQLFVKR